MNTFYVSLGVLLGGIGTYAQNVPVTAPAVAVPAGSLRTAAELDQLVAPIALYPDALIALMLPASTVPTDIVLAARYLRENPGDRSQIEHRAWEESVKSLTSYPEVVQWMDENLQWTQQLGEAFARQPADVMEAVQRLRAKARAAGTLVDTPQQQVIAEPQVIRIVPAQPDVIYVPHYEPEVVFVDRPIYYSRPFLTFGVGVPVGSWLAFDCDWRRRTIWVGDRHRHWKGHDWHRPVVPIANSFHPPRNFGARPWSPPPAVSRPHVAISRPYRSEIVRPAPFATTVSRTYVSRDADRRPDYDRTPASGSQPRTFTPSYRSENSPTRSSPVTPHGVNRSANSPRDFSAGLAAPVINAVPATAPEIQPLPQSRRSPGTWTRDGDTRDRSYREHRATAAAPPPVTSALPAAPPPQLVQPANPAPQRSFSGRANVQPPAAAPVQAAPASPPVRGNRSAPPAAAPASTSEATPPASSAPASRNGGESRGRGWGNREAR